MQLVIHAKEHITEPGLYFESCHASSIAAPHGEDRLVAWFAGTREGAPDVGIWLARRHQGLWRKPTLVAKDEHLPCWNPVLWAAENGAVHLYYKVGENPKVWQTLRMISTDGGHTFSPPEPLVPGDVGGRGPVKNKLLRTSDGRWIAPASIETEQGWYAFADISEDRGATWRKAAPVPVDPAGLNGQGLIQPTLWESAPGRIHMLLRSSGGRVYRSDSRDNGETWCAAYPTELPNNNSGIDLARTESGVLALAYNPVATNWGARTPLSLALSADNGLTWPYRKTIEENLAPRDREDGEFSYPAIVVRGERLLLTYTWKRKTIEFVEAEARADAFEI